MTDAPSPRGYLPLPCPVCGRHRLLPTVVVVDGVASVAAVACEKCETAWPDHMEETA